MALKLTAFPMPNPLRHSSSSSAASLIKNPPDTVPPTEELEALQHELMRMKTLAAERGKKAANDVRAIQESYRRMKEKEKGKAKAFAAAPDVKREREHTPVLDRATPSELQRLEELRKKKKKRKREYEDSGDEHDVPHAPPPKAHKSIPSVSVALKPHNTQPDFSLPPTGPLVPLRPPIPPAPTPGPTHPTAVTEDFSKIKQPANQVQIPTFLSSIDPYLRPIREEDVGFLEWHYYPTSSSSNENGNEKEEYDDLDVFIMPKLGRHYQVVWDDQDAGRLPPTTATVEADPTMLNKPPQPTWDPSQLSDTDCWSEERGHGPLTERVISALLPIEEYEWKGVKAAEDAMEGRPGGSGAAASKKERLNVEDLEKRIRDNMRYHALLHDIPDYSNKVDDPIATALRQLQSELRVVSATNKARKLRLAAIARDRLAYQEFIELRDNIDRNITATYNKLMKRDLPKSSKKKKKERERDRGGSSGGGGEEEALSVPMPSALGLGPDEDNNLVVSQQLRELVETRRRWDDDIGAVFREKQEESPGRIWGMPDRPVFEGIEEEVRTMLAGAGGGGRHSRGETRDMDVG